MEAIIDTCIKKTMTFHDILYEFLAGRGTGTYIMELEITQDLGVWIRTRYFGCSCISEIFITTWNKAGY